MILNFLLSFPIFWNYIFLIFSVSHWNSEIWDFVISGFVIWDFVFWDFVNWDFDFGIYFCFGIFYQWDFFFGDFVTIPILAYSTDMEDGSAHEFCNSRKGL